MNRLVLLLTPVLVLSLGALAWAASLTVTSQKLEAAAAATPTMFPVSVTIANKAGGIAGRPESGDIATLVLSGQLDEPTMCSGWSNASSTQSLTLQWSIVNGGAGNDTLSVTGTSGTCSTGLHVGGINLGSAGYNTSTAAINFSTALNALVVGGSTTTLTVTLNGLKNGTPGTVTSGTAAVWTPDAVLRDRAGNSSGSNLATSTATVQF